MNGNGMIRAGTAAAVLFVAAIAAVVSFVHIQHLAVTHGQTWLAAALLPLSIDGTVAAASLVMLWAAREKLPTPWLARFMLAAAVIATLAANVYYGRAYGMPGALLSGWPAGAFIGCAELALWMVRRTARAVPVGVPVRQAVVKPLPSVRQLRDEAKCSQATAVKIRKAMRTYAVASNGHGGSHE